MRNASRCIAFHSYKGGTGKTTLAANLSALLASKGYRVALLDLDVYAPSLNTYFETTPAKWINDLLLNNAEIDEVMVDLTPALKSVNEKSATGLGGLSVAFSNPDKEAVYKLEGSSGKQPGQKLNALRKFIQLREDLISKYEFDYLIIDTSPGIRFWSINSLAISDILLLTLKFGDLDIAGTKKISREIYSSFTEFGARSYALLNRMSGYCVPHTPQQGITKESRSEFPTEFEKNFSHEMDLDLVSSIPCYCDIQFLRKEFLTVLQYPDHPFTRKLESLTEAEQIKVTPN